MTRFSPISFITLILSILCLIVFVFYSCETVTDKELIEIEVTNYIQVAPARIVAKHVNEFPQDFAKIISNNLFYKITDITINDNVATVTVQINNVDLETTFATTTAEYLIWRDSKLADDPNIPEEQLKDAFITMFMKKSAKAESLPTVECVFELTKFNDKWQISKLDRNIFYKAISGNLLNFD